MNCPLFSCMVRIICDRSSVQIVFLVGVLCSLWLMEDCLMDVWSPL